MYGAEIDICGRTLRALYLCYMILLIPTHSRPDSGAHVGAVPASVLQLAKFHYSSVRSAQRSEKLQKKKSSTDTNRRGEQAVWEVEAAQVEGENRCRCK